MCSGVLDGAGAGAGSAGAAGPWATGDGLLGPSATVPVPALTVGLGVGDAGVLVLPVGVLGPDDGVSCGCEGCTTGLLTVPPAGADALLLADGLADADVVALLPGALDAPLALALAPGDGVVPSLAVGMFPGATLPLPPDGRPDWAGSGEVSTLPAGGSSFCPGTGSQGASELPDNRVTTMTTA